MRNKKTEFSSRQSHCQICIISEPQPDVHVREIIIVLLRRRIEREVRLDYSNKELGEVVRRTLFREEKAKLE